MFTGGTTSASEARRPTISDVDLKKLDLDNDGQLDEEEVKALKHLFLQGSDGSDPEIEFFANERARKMATWQNTSLLTALFLTFTVPMAHELTSGGFQLLFSIFNGAAIFFQLFGLAMTVQLMIKLEQAGGGAVATVAFMRSPMMTAVDMTAYACSYGIQLWATALAIVMLVLGSVEWETRDTAWHAWISPMIVFAIGTITYIGVVIITNMAKNRAQKVESKALKALREAQRKGS